MSQLKKAREDMLRYREICARLENMYARRGKVQDSERTLRQTLEKERQDVAKLEAMKNERDRIVNG